MPSLDSSAPLGSLPGVNHPRGTRTDNLMGAATGDTVRKGPAEAGPFACLLHGSTGASAAGSVDA